MSKIKFKINAKTDRGIMREHNEDNYIVCPDLKENVWYFKKDISYQLSPKGCIMAVADGMGGHTHGQLASSIAIETVQEKCGQIDVENINDLATFFNDLFWSIQNKLLELAKETPSLKGMGTTLVVAVITEHVYQIAWVGDSRAYVFRDNKLKLLSKDHTMLQQMLEEKKIKEEDLQQNKFSNLSHILTRCLSSSDAFQEYDLVNIEAREGDLLLLCSDGLSGLVNDKAIEHILKNETLSDMTDKLVHAAIQNGGPDNITAVIYKSEKRSTPLNIQSVNVGYDLSKGTIKQNNSVQRDIATKYTPQIPREERVMKNAVILALILLFLVGMFAIQNLRSVEDTSENSKLSPIDNGNIGSDRQIIIPAEILPLKNDKGDTLHLQEETDPFIIDLLLNQ